MELYDDYDVYGHLDLTIYAIENGDFEKICVFYKRQLNFVKVKSLKR